MSRKISQVERVKSNCPVPVCEGRNMNSSSYTLIRESLPVKKYSTNVNSKHEFQCVTKLLYF